MENGLGLRLGIRLGLGLALGLGYGFNIRFRVRLKVRLTNLTSHVYIYLLAEEQQKAIACSMCTASCPARNDCELIVCPRPLSDRTIKLNTFHSA